MKIIIPGVPIPKARPRFVQRGRYFATYDPQANLKVKVRKQMELLCPDALISHSKVPSVDYLWVRLEFHLPIATSDSRYLKSLKLWGLVLPGIKPDLDNLEKFYLDCGNGILWDDDSQIVHLSSSKYYTNNPRTEIGINEEKGLSVSEMVRNVLGVFDPDLLKEFIMDAGLFSLEALRELDSSVTLGREMALSSMAASLVRFAVKYAAPLNKIRKFDVLPLSEWEKTNKLTDRS